MTDEEFVLSVYPDAKLRCFDSRSMINMCIEISDPPYRAIGYCADTTAKMCWWFARKDIEFEMLRKMES